MFYLSVSKRAEAQISRSVVYTASAQRGAVQQALQIRERAPGNQTYRQTESLLHTMTTKLVVPDDTPLSREERTRKRRSGRRRTRNKNFEKKKTRKRRKRMRKNILGRSRGGRGG